ATIDSCIVLLILHCCGQLEILCEKIKKFHGLIRHNLINRNKDCSNTVRIINNCSCLQCIVEKHNYLIHFVKVLDESIHGLMLLQLIPGTISFCTNGYGLIKSYTNGDISSMIYHIIYIFAIMPIFLTLCSVSDDLLQKVML
ncbi:GSCOCT00014051001.2-RA-CDS, partial [Cotesia congregata]